MTMGSQPNATVDYGYYLSDSSRKRQPSAIRSLFPVAKLPGMISFLAGLPNPTTFPITSLSLSVAVPGSTTDPATSSNPPSQTLTISGEDLENALQYGATAGAPRLVEWLEKFQERVHGRTREGPKTPGAQSNWRISVGMGSQDLLNKAFDVLIDPEDSVLIESPVYAGVIPPLQMQGCTLFEVENDGQGLSPPALRSMLANWTAPGSSTAHRRFPKILYTIPNGSNPAGTTASEERKREVLAIARKYNLLILEDDPYAYLSFVETASGRNKSYFTLELEGMERWGCGRVLRFDSLSKVLSAGLRIGFVTGPVQLLEAIDRHTQSSTLQPSGPSQAITLALLEHYGIDGFLKHVDGVASFYKAKRDVFEKALEQHLTGLAEWVTPVAGMFYWLRLLITDSPDDEGDSFDLISNKAQKNLVLAVPGMAFFPNGRKNPYVRVSFSIPTEEQMQEGLRRLRQVILDARAENAVAKKEKRANGEVNGSA